MLVARIQINRYHVFNFNVNENMYVSSKEIKIRMKSIFQSQRFLIRYVSRDKEDQMWVKEL